MSVCICVCEEWEGRGSNLMLLISANELNLEGRLSSYICWLGDCGEEQKASERGGKRCAVVYTQCALYQAAVPSLSRSLSFPAQLNGNRKKQKAKQKFRFSSQLTPLHTAQHLTHSLCGLHQRALLLIALLSLWTHTYIYIYLLCISVGSNAALEQLVEYTQWKLPSYLSPVMNSLPGFSGARISGCWTLRSDGG